MTAEHDPGPVPAATIDVAPSTDDLLTSQRLAIIDLDRALREVTAARDRGSLAAAATWREQAQIAAALVATATQEIDARLTRGGKLPTAWAKAKRT